MFDKLKWNKMSLARQIGNIGSEVSQAFYWKDKKEEKGKQLANRTLELFDATIDDNRWHNQLTEILKMRSVFCDTYFQLGNFNVSEKSINNYFIPFAMVANSKK